jgi:hypothetical protein
MAIAYPVTMPIGADGRTLIQSLQIGVVSKVGISESPFTFKQQIQDYNDSRWEGTITTRPLFGDDALAMRAFFMSLKGRLGTFQFSVPQELSNDYELGAFFDGEDSIRVATKSGVTPSHTMKAGTYFQIDTTDKKLFMVIEDANIDVSENTDIIPVSFGATASTGKDLITTNPICTAKLMNNTSMYNVGIREGHSFSFAFHGV